MVDTENPNEHDLRESATQREEVVSEDPLLSILKRIEGKLDLLLGRKSNQGKPVPTDFPEELPPNR